MRTDSYLLLNYALITSAIICGLIALLFVLAGLVRAHELRLSGGAAVASKVSMKVYFTSALLSGVLVVVCVTFYAAV